MMAYRNLLVLMVLSCLSKAEQNCSSNEGMDKCTVRYDVALLMSKFVNFTAKNCQATVFRQPSFCNEELTIIYYESRPYIHRLKNGRMDGILPALLSLALKTCCNNCTRIKYRHNLNFWQDFHTYFHNDSFYSMLMPALAVKGEEEFFGKPFIRLMDNPGVVFIQLDDEAEFAMSALLNSIITTWPLFAVLLLLTVKGGIIIWLLDGGKNSIDFPPGFFKGIWEGGWWAYISMTTVGYGDKTPKSYFGRIFSVFWITLGIAISGMFTASLSSSLTSALMQKKTDLNNLKVGILINHSLGYEENIAFKEGAIPKTYMNDTEMIEDLKTGKLNGIMMDKLVFDYTQRRYNIPGLKLKLRTDIPKSDAEIGVMFSSHSLKKWSIFLGSFYKANRDAEIRLLSEAMQTLNSKVSMVVEETAQPSNIFASPNVTRPLLTGLGGAAAVLFVVAFVIKCICRWASRRSIARISLAKAEAFEVKQTELKSFKARTLSI